MSYDIGTTISPAHQEIAARLVAAAVDLDAERIDQCVGELAVAGLPAALAVVAALTRWCAVELVEYHGLEQARAILTTTVLQCQGVDIAPGDLGGPPPEAVDGE